MVRQKRDVAVIVIKCAIMGWGASAQQAALGSEMTMSSMPVVGVIQDVVDNNVKRQSLGRRLPEGGNAPLLPLALPQPDLVASASQAVGSYILAAQEIKNADTPVEPQASVQETKNADAPAEPQAVMREIKSATRLSSSKQRRRKPKMAAIPIGSRTVAQETKEPESEVLVKETKESGSQAAVPGAKEPGSQATGQEAEEADALDKQLAAAQETKSSNVPTKSQEGVKELKVADVRKKRYAMAPVRWGVRLSETVGLVRTSLTDHHIDPARPAIRSATSSSSSSLVNTQTVDAKGTTYILQPYIASLAGNVGLVSSKNSSSSNSSSINTSGRSNGLYGGGSLSLFSQSRFPFTMSLGIKDSRSNTELDTQDTVSKNLSLRQTYRPLGSTSTYSGGYQRDTQDTITNGSGAPSRNFANDIATHSSWQGSYITQTVEHRVNISTRFNEKTTSLLNNINKRTDDFTVTDAYLPSNSLLSLYSFANLNLFTDTNQRSRYLLVNTNVNWQPEDENIPLFVDGRVHLFDQLNTTAGAATKLQSLGMEAGANYLFSKNLTGRASGSVTTTSSGGQRDLVTNQGGNVSYRSDAVRFWKNSSYSWNANGGAFNSTGSSANNGVTGGVGQGMSVPYPLDMFGKKLEIRSGINQSLAARISRIDGHAITLINTGSVSLGAPLASIPNKELLGGDGRLSGAMNTSVTLSVSDIHISGRNASHNRQVSLAGRLLEASNTVYSRSGLTVSATLEAVQGTGGGGFALVGSSVARYRKPRVFNVRGLDYVGSLSIQSSSRSNPTTNAMAEDVNARNPRFPWTLDQRLTYKIGQNEVLLKGLVSDQYGVKNASLWLLFRAWRTIGN